VPRRLVRRGPSGGGRRGGPSRLSRLLPRAVACLIAVASAARAAPAEPPTPDTLTDAHVREAIERGKVYLVSRARPSGAFSGGSFTEGRTALAFMTLAYMGEHPNRPHMARALDYLLSRDADADFDDRQGYAVPMRAMGLSYVYRKLLGERRDRVADQVRRDLARLQEGQTEQGGWRYRLQADADYDFSVTQWPILAFRDAHRAGLTPADLRTHLLKARGLYLKHQQTSGGWYYQDKKEPPSGSMTAAGLASLYIIADFLEPGMGCPCMTNGRSPHRLTPTARAIDAALDWVAEHFSAEKNPGAEKIGKNETRYWLYCVERVGIAAGYKYFGRHNWYREGAAALVADQRTNGSWNRTIEDTCFALLFLYKGRAPVLVNKLQFDGIWNAHPRDAANLTHYIETAKEQMFHWQIVDTGAPLAEWHDAPLLYITAEGQPDLTDDQARRLRRFTDTGGTILVEASCGNPVVRQWFETLARKTWPEWDLQDLGPDHPVWEASNRLETRPEIRGIHDGVRTAVFYSPDDVSCAWQTRDLARKRYLFDWGINLYTYATDRSPLRAKLAQRAPAAHDDRFTRTVTAGPTKRLVVARLRHTGNWAVGANYGGLARLAEAVRDRTGMLLEMPDPCDPPVNTGGTRAADLDPATVAYLAAPGPYTLNADEREALARYLAAGGFLVVEAVTGSRDAVHATYQLAKTLGWTLTRLPDTHPLVSGMMDGAEGYNLARNVTFRRAVRTREPDRDRAEFWGLFAGDRLVGLLSPYDIAFSLTGYEAFDCRGYAPRDAAAVATNLALYLSTIRTDR